MTPTLLLSFLLACTGGKDDSSAQGGGATDPAATGACAGLCTDAGFSDGTETDYGNRLIECVCEGTGAALTQDACTAYCAPFGVDAAHSYLGEDVSPNDKCACDGTSPG